VKIGILSLLSLLMMNLPLGLSQEDDVYFESRSSDKNSGQPEANLGLGSTAHLGDVRDAYLATMRGEETQQARQMGSPLDIANRLKSASPTPAEEAPVELEETERLDPYRSYLSYERREREEGIYRKRSILVERRRLGWREERPAYRYARRLGRAPLQGPFGLFSEAGSSVSPAKPKRIKPDETPRMDYLRKLNQLYKMREKMIARNAPSEQIARLERKIVRMRMRRPE
jgi:hypothetical protein